MKLNQVDINYLEDLFPQHSFDYFLSLSCHFNNLETMVEYLLKTDDKDIKPLELSIEEYLYNTRIKNLNRRNIFKRKSENYQFKEEENEYVLFYEEIFKNEYFEKLDFNKLRVKADDYFKKYLRSLSIEKSANKMKFKQKGGAFHKTQSVIYNNKSSFSQVSNDYAKDTSDIKEITFSQSEEDFYYFNHYNYQAALNIIYDLMKKRTIQDGHHILDFHNLYVNECIDFLTDYLHVHKKNFKKISIITGKSKKIKPKIIEHLKINNILHSECDVNIVIYSKKEYKLNK